MEWFKFYNSKWLSDLAVISLDPIDRLCFITLLCVTASRDERNGTVTQYHEHRILMLTHLSPDDYNKGVGFTKRLVEVGLIETDGDKSITIKNFEKRQSTNLSGAERAKKYRDTKSQNKKVTNVTNKSDESNARVDKSRVDKNISKTSLQTNMPIKGYNENQHNDDIPSIGDDGEIEKTNADLLKETNEKVTVLIEWAEKIRGKKFLDTPTQRKMVHEMRKNKISPQLIKDTFVSLIHSEYWTTGDGKGRLPDFKTVLSALKNKK